MLTRCPAKGPKKKSVAKPPSCGYLTGRKCLEKIPTLKKGNSIKDGSDNQPISSTGTVGEVLQGRKEYSGTKSVSSPFKDLEKRHEKEEGRSSSRKEDNN